MRIGKWAPRAWALTAMSASILALTGQAVAAQQINVLETRPGVTLRLFLETPAGPAKAVLLMFPGGEGAKRFQEEGGKIVLMQDFPGRTTPDFVGKGFAVAIIDAPSDHASGMIPGFRNTPEHLQDVRRVVNFLDAQGLSPIYLLGVSNGTLSVGYAGALLNDERIKGLVLCSTLAERFVSGPLIQKITLPVLMVHHREDGCPASPFQEAERLKTKFTGSPKVDFVEVQGGLPPQSGPCTALSRHGFLGMEDQVVQVITDWVSGKPVPTKVGP